MPNPPGMCPAWERDSFTRSPARYWIVFFHHHKISFRLNLGLENKGLCCASEPGTPSAALGIPS